ncbi:hypothetical protein TrST_g9428 [Triparma strigata]|uniref:Cyclic nucleotide-binding domain-containing protein n=1 Tax=Triparma strigata TaxID=1606541 RepID=A0A9W7EFE8_9STRA|nr:hypothetical protein TrST_g9428 [Triparma strigata]
MAMQMGATRIRTDDNDGMHDTRLNARGRFQSMANPGGKISLGLASDVGIAANFRDSDAPSNLIGKKKKYRRLTNGELKIFTPEEEEKLYLSQGQEEWIEVKSDDEPDNDDDDNDNNKPSQDPPTTPGGRPWPKPTQFSDGSQALDMEARKQSEVKFGKEEMKALDKVVGIWGGDKEMIATENAKKKRAMIDKGQATLDDILATKVKEKAKKWEKKAKARISERKYVIDPRAKWKLYWDVLCGIFIIYSVIVIPFRLFFIREAKGFSSTFDWVIDATFLLDMIFSFRTGYMSKQGHIVMSPRRIMKSYLRSWFIIDFFSTVPIDTIINVLFAVPKAQLRTIKMVRILRLARLAKLAKLVSRGSLQLILAAINPAILRLMTLILSILFVAHFLACFWAAVNICEYEEPVTQYDTIGPVDSGSLISKCGNSNSYPLWVSQYLASFYWVIATMMAVGYGDIFAVTNAERLYAIFVEIVGAGCFGFIISTTTQIVETMSPETRIRKNELELIHEYSKFRALPSGMTRRIKKHFEYLYTQKSVFDELAVLRQLPVGMRVDLTLTVHSAKVEKLHKIFENLDHHFVAELILVLRPFFMHVGETIRVDGFVPDQVYVVNSGHLQVLRPEGGSWIIAGLMNEGSVAGMSSAMLNKKADFMLCAPIATDMWFIETHELKMVLDYYPEDTHTLSEMNHRNHVNETQCWESPTMEIEGVKVKELICVDNVPTSVSDVDRALLAGTEELRNATGKKKKNLLIKTVRVTADGPTEGLELAKDILARNIIDPGTKEKTIWDVAIGLLIVFSVAVVPLRLGFDIPATTPWMIIDWTTDILFTFDIFITFRTGYLDDHNSLVTVPALIRNRYLRFWFVIDLLSTVPIDKIVMLFVPAGGGGLRSLKLIRIVRLVRLLKLAKLLKIDTSAVEEVIEIDQTVTKTFRLFGILFGLAHFFGCFWNMATDVEVEALGYENMTDFLADNPEPEENELGDNYVGALYWAFTTMTTVGYGDVLPEDDGARLYATIMMIMGATMFSYIVGSASSIVTNEKSGEKQSKERLLALYNYCVDRGVSKPLEKRLKRNLNFCLNQCTPFEEVYIFDCLPSQLRSELIMAVKKDAMEKICIFSKSRNMSYVSCVLQYFLTCQFVRRDVLYQPLVGSRGMYFILKGKVSKCLYHGQEEGQLNMFNVPRLVCVGLPYGENEFVGFDAVATHDDDEKFGALCLEDCQCYFLSNEALTLILMRHPAVADTLIKAIKEEGLALHEKRKKKGREMTKGELQIMKMDNNDNEGAQEYLEKESLQWGQTDAFNKFVMNHSRANPAIADADASEADAIIQPLLAQGMVGRSSSITDAMLEVGRIGSKGDSGDLEAKPESGDIDSGETPRHINRHTSSRDISFEGEKDQTSLEGSQRRSSINASLSNHIVDMALKHDDNSTSDTEHYTSKGRMLSGGFVVHPDAHENTNHESHLIVKKAVTKASRRISHVDPLMGTHGGNHSNHTSPFAMKTAPVMRPAGKIDTQMEGWTSRRTISIQPSTGPVLGSTPPAGSSEKRKSDPSLTRKKSASNLILDLSEKDIIDTIGNYAGGKAPITPKEKKK